jgi:hypothetical protein
MIGNRTEWHRYEGDGLGGVALGGLLAWLLGGNFTTTMLHLGANLSSLSLLLEQSISRK